jgi:hypothetical protein
MILTERAVCSDLSEHMKRLFILEELFIFKYIYYISLSQLMPHCSLCTFNTLLQWLPGAVIRSNEKDQVLFIFAGKTCTM